MQMQTYLGQMGWDHSRNGLTTMYSSISTKKRAAWCREIVENGGRIHDGSRIWYSGKIMPDGEFDEDCSSILCNLRVVSPHQSASDDGYSYGDNDIDLLSSHLDSLGLPSTIP